MQQLTRGFLMDLAAVTRWGFVCGAAAILTLSCQVAASQMPSLFHPTGASTYEPSIESICSSQSEDSAKAALSLLCQEGRLASGRSLPSSTIVIGFVGGFANPHDLKHPEVLFATYLREHYGPQLHARVFSNHGQNEALQYVSGLLDTNRDGFLSEEEKNSARIIIYGHSWGASQTVAFARTLRHYSIPVLLTVQLDTVGKWGQRPTRIPGNVDSAVNFFQSEGLLHGRPDITPEDETRTEIVGNFRSSYVAKPVDCSNYPWLARTFNKPHHEIENDPAVWSQIALLIDSKISGSSSAQDAAANTTTAISEAPQIGLSANH